MKWWLEFQSTPPVKAATDNLKLGYGGTKQISIHAAREGGDVVLLLGVSDLTLFQSTPPVKAATSPLLRQL